MCICLTKFSDGGVIHFWLEWWEWREKESKKEKGWKREKERQRERPPGKSRPALPLPQAWNWSRPPGQLTGLYSTIINQHNLLLPQYNMLTCLLSPQTQTRKEKNTSVHTAGGTDDSRDREMKEEGYISPSFNLSRHMRTASVRASIRLESWASAGKIKHQIFFNVSFFEWLQSVDHFISVKTKWNCKDWQNPVCNFIIMSWLTLRLTLKMWINIQDKNTFVKPV